MFESKLDLESVCGKCYLKLDLEIVLKAKFGSNTPKTNME